MRISDYSSSNMFFGSTERAKKILGEKEIVSLKIRPIDNYPINADDVFWEVTVYPEDYEYIEEELTKYLKIQPQKVDYDIYEYNLGSDRTILFIRHETGPELIIAAAVLAATSPLLNDIKLVISKVLKTLINRIHTNSRKIGGFTFEKRVADKTTLIKILRPTQAENGNPISKEELIHDKKNN